MDIKKSENELSSIKQEGENDGFIAYRKAYEVDREELKNFATEIFGNSEMDDVVMHLITNPLTEVASLLELEANGEMKDRYPIILFGVISFLELSDTNSCNLLRNLSERYSSDSFGRTISKFFSDAKNKLKLLFYERKDYATPELCHHLLSNLNNSIENIDNDHFLYISKICKATKRDAENLETKTVIWLNTEDRKFAEQAIDFFEYPADTSIVSGLPKWGCPLTPDNWGPGDYTNAEPWRRIYLIQLKKLDTIYKKLKDQFSY